jgi:hypothetical protein
MKSRTKTYAGLAVLLAGAVGLGLFARRLPAASEPATSAGSAAEATSAPQPLAAVDQTGEFVLARAVPLANPKDEMLVGVVHNRSELVIHQPRVEVTFYSEQGDVVGSAEAGALTDFLGPGQHAPAKIAVMGSRMPYHSRKIRVLYISGSGSDVPREVPLLAETPKRQGEPTRDGSMQFVRYAGAVQNNSDIDVQSVRIVVEGYDESGKLVDVEGMKLGPMTRGENRTFELTFNAASEALISRMVVTARAPMP